MGLISISSSKSSNFKSEHLRRAFNSSFEGPLLLNKISLAVDYRPFLIIKHFSEIQNSYFLTGLNGNYLSCKFKFSFFSRDERKPKKRQHFKSFLRLINMTESI